MDKIINVPYLDQSKAAPTGCESVTTVMLLNYLGYDISINEFIDSYLDKEPFEMRDGQLYGPHPARCFAGDPYDPEAMGCYAPVIKNSLERILGDKYEVIDETGTEIDELVEKYIIGEGLPVALWATIDLKAAIEGPYWKLTETGEDFTWWSNEHCFLLTGCEGDTYVINDPWNNNGIILPSKSLVRQRHKEQHMQAVALKKKA